MSDEAQFAISLAYAAIVFFLLLLIFVAERWRRIHSARSAAFITANASTYLSKKVRRLVAPGVEILMPVGHGLYPLALREADRRTWENEIEDWLKQGVHLTIIITSPNDEAIKYWQNMIDRFPPKLRVCILDRGTASPEDAIKIERLNTFHPILISKDNEPLGMWVEAYHAPRSPVAYGVEYVARDDIVDYQRSRFDRFLEAQRRLTSGTPQGSRFLKSAAAAA